MPSKLAVCANNLTVPPARCLPLCPPFSNDNCPDLPLELGGDETTCNEVTVMLGDFISWQETVCSREVEVGALCDNGARLCNHDDTRPDTDGETKEGISFDDIETGMLRCIPVPLDENDPLTEYEGRCLRVCDMLLAPSESPCECPPEDSLCEDPIGGWSCADWSDQVPGWSICIDATNAQ